MAVCRDHANGQCRRKQCKYYHIPVILPPADIMATIINNNNSTLTTTTPPSTSSTISTTATIESVAISPQTHKQSSPTSATSTTTSTTFWPYDYFLKNLTGPYRELNCYSFLSLDTASLSPPSIISNSPIIYNSSVRGSFPESAPSTQNNATSTSP